MMDIGTLYALQPSTDKEAFIIMVERVVIKRQEYSITLDEGWYSEQEMRDELGWSQPGAYYGCVCFTDMQLH